MDKISESSQSVTVEDRSKVILESEAVQRQKGDCLPTGVIIPLPAVGKIDFEQNDLRALKQVWQQMKRSDDFAKKYGLIAFLIQVQPNIPMLKAMLHFWDPSLRCFTFQNIDMVPTIEEYSKIINVDLPSKEKVYFPYHKKTTTRILSKLLGVHAKEIQDHMIDKKSNLNATYLLQFAQNNVDTDYGLTAFALAIYGLVIFPKVKGQIDRQVIKLFEQIEHKVNPAIPILAETIRSLNYCRLNKKGRFRSCSQLLTVWMMSHFPVLKHFNFPKIDWGLYRPGFHNPAREYSNVEWPLELPTRNQWIEFFLGLQEVVWIAPWMSHTYALYRCGNKPWVPLVGPWGIISYAPALVRRQLGSKQFIPMTHGLADFEFTYGEENVAEKVKEAIEAWKDARYVKQGSSTGITPGYHMWQTNRGKGFIAPRVESPDLPIHTFSEPIDYVAEAEGKFEMMYRELKIKECKATSEKELWNEKLRKAKEEVQREKERSSWMEQQIRGWKNKCSNLDASLKDKNMEIASVNQKNRAMHSDLNYLKSKLEENSQNMFLLQEEKESINADRTYWHDRSQEFERQHNDLVQKTCGLLNDIQQMARKAQKRAREAEEAEEEVPSGKAREFLVSIKKELDYFGSFH